MITTCTEHPAVMETAKFLESQGIRVTFLPVTSEGLVDAADLRAAITAQTTVVSIMYANNETGTLQPIAEFARLLKSVNPRILFHTDASQAIGKVACSVADLGVDYLTVAGHKFYAPKGIGALYTRAGTPPLFKILHGASHESSKRPGTENVIHIVGLGKAAEIARRDFAENSVRLRRLRDELLDRIMSKLSARSTSSLEGTIRINGPRDPSKRLPNTLSISFADVNVLELMKQIEGEVACSAGAACHSGLPAASAVLKAMRVPERFANGTLRLSVGVSTTPAQIEAASTIVADAVARLSPHFRAHLPSRL